MAEIIEPAPMECCGCVYWSPWRRRAVTRWSTTSPPPPPPPPPPPDAICKRGEKKAAGSSTADDWEEEATPGKAPPPPVVALERIRRCRHWDVVKRPNLEGLVRSLMGCDSSLEERKSVGPPAGGSFSDCQAPEYALAGWSLQRVRRPRPPLCANTRQRWSARLPNCWNSCSRGLCT
jgi:hypothetical protein